jgi:large subunit ribosomal protein L18
VYKNNVTLKANARSRIRKRIRKKISGTPERPRAYVFKSNRHIYVQLIDDENGSVLLSASTREKEFETKSKSSKNKGAAKTVGEMIAKKAKSSKIKTVIFDRGIYPYHGRVKTLAEAMRKGGLSF